LAICVALQAYNAYSTLETVQELQEEIDSIGDQIDALNRSCPVSGNDMDRVLQQGELLQEANELEREATGELLLGSGLGIGLGIACVGLVALL
jgi:hypothetical protein